MEKLEREFLENGGEWKEFDFDKLFNVARGDIQNQKNLIRNDVGVSFVAQNDINNGYVYKVSNNDYRKFKGNSIIIGRQTGVIYYQPEEFITTDGVLILEEKIPLIKNKRIGLFICSLMKKHMVIYGYTNTVSAKKLNNLKLELPFLNGKINFSYMEKFIEELEAERIEELEAYLIATGLKDYKLTKEDQKILDDFEKMSDNSLDRRTDKIRLGNIFNIESPKKKFNANSIKFDGEYPYVARGETNNGIKGYITEEIDYLNNGNTISFGQDTATMFYQKTPYFTGDKIKILSPKLYSLDTDIALYYITATKKTLSTFSWGSTSYNVNNLENIIIELPIEDNKIDITFMDEFIKVVKKLIIKDVVIWADKKIEATKQVVFKH